MKQVKKCLIVFLIVTILLPCLFGNSVVLAETEEDYSGIEWGYEFSDEQEREVHEAYGEGATLGLTMEQQKYLKVYVETYLSEAYKQTPRPFVYDAHNLTGYVRAFHQNERDSTRIGSSGTWRGGQPYTNKLVFVCSVFTAAMLHQAVGAYFEDPMYRGAGYASVGGNGATYFNRIEGEEILQVGDVISEQGFHHSMLYIGKDTEGYHVVAETCGGTRVIGINRIRGSKVDRPLTVNLLRQLSPIYAESGGRSLYHVSRIKPERIPKEWTLPSVARIQWPDGTLSSFDTSDLDNVTISTGYDPSRPLFYDGLATPVGTLGHGNGLKDFINRLVNFFSELLDGLIGLITMALRIPIVGWMYIIENLLTATIQTVSTEPMSTVTLEKIIFNQIGFFDINIFNTQRNYGSVTASLRQNISMWYFAFRTIVIASLFLALLYMGVRMAISNIAEEKAKYKRMIVDWAVSFFMVMFIHYFIVVIFGINDFLVDMLYRAMQNNSGVESVYDKARSLAYSIKFTEGWYGTILYIALVWFTVKFALKYARRLLTAYILIILSPFVSIVYAIDKIKDNRAQSLGKWLKEIAFTALIQSVHAIIYSVFMAIILTIVENATLLNVIGSIVLMIIAIKFMETAEETFKNIFGFNSSSILKEATDTTFEALGKAKLVKNVARTYGKTAKFAGKGIGKVAGFTAKNIVGKPTRFVGNHVKPVGAVVKGYDKLKDGAKGLRDGYKGKLRDAKTTTGIDRWIQAKRMQQQSLIQDGRREAKTMYNTGKNAVKNAAKGLGTLFSKTAASVSYMIASGTAAHGVKILAKKRRERMKSAAIKGVSRLDEKGFKARNGTYGKMRYLQKEERELTDFREKDIEFRETVEEAWSREDGLIARGQTAPEGSALAEKSKYAQEMVMQTFRARATIFNQAQIQAIISKIILNTNGRGLTIGAILDELEKANPNVTFNREAMSQRLREELALAMSNVANNRPEAISLKFNQEIGGGELLGDRLFDIREEAIANKGKTLSGNRRERAETAMTQAINDIIFNEATGEGNTRAIMETLDMESLSMLISRAASGKTQAGQETFRVSTEASVVNHIYGEVLEKSMRGNTPSSVADIGSFATRMRGNMTETQREMFDTHFERSVESQLSRIGIAMREITAEDERRESSQASKEQIRHDLAKEELEQVVGEERLEEIIETLRANKVQGREAAQRAFEMLTEEEKAKLSELDFGADEEQQLRRIEEAVIDTPAETRDELEQIIGEDRLEEIAERLETEGLEKGQAAARLYDLLSNEERAKLQTERFGTDQEQQLRRIEIALKDVLEDDRHEEEIISLTDDMQGEFRGELRHILSESRLREIAEKINSEGISRDKMTARIFELLSDDEKKSLFASSIRINLTDDISRELDHFKDAFEKTSEFSRSVVTITTRTGIFTREDLRTQIQEIANDMKKKDED